MASSIFSIANLRFLSLDTIILKLTALFPSCRPQLQSFERERKRTRLRYFALLSDHITFHAAARKTLYVIMDGEVRSTVTGLNVKWKQLTTKNCLRALKLYGMVSKLVASTCVIEFLRGFIVKKVHPYLFKYLLFHSDHEACHEWYIIKYEAVATDEFLCYSIGKERFGA
jgi:hypothetical protein